MFRERDDEQIELRIWEEMEKTRKRILSYEQARDKISEYKVLGKKTVLGTGAWDWLHIGHLFCLQGFRNIGGILFVGAENDESLRLNKGRDRPICSLDERLITLATIVDFAFGFPDVPRYIDPNDKNKRIARDANFDMFVQRLRFLQPDILAVSPFDPNLENKRIQTTMAGVELVVADHQTWGSTTEQLKGGRPTRTYPWMYLISRVVREYS